MSFVPRTDRKDLLAAVLLGTLVLAHGPSFATGSFSLEASESSRKKYVFDPDTLAQLGVQAHIQANQQLRYDIDDPELRALHPEQDLRQSTEFDKAMISRLGSNEAYQVLIQAALNFYSGLKGSVVEKGTDGILYVKKPNGQKSLIQPKDLLFGYHFEITVQVLHQLLKARYPGQILDEVQRPWNNVGGVFAQILIFSCSFSEYLAGFFTMSAVPHGFSGVYPSMDVYDVLFSGEMTSNNSKNPLERFPMGYYSHLNRKDSWVYSMSAYTGMIDLGQGNVTANIWQGIIAPTLFHNFDFGSMNSQLKSCAKSIFTRAWLRLGFGK